MKRGRPPKKPPKKARRKVQAPNTASGYLAWSRDPAVSLFAVLPLWILYEGLRLSLTPDEYNGAEALMTQSVGALGPLAIPLLRVAFALTVFGAAFSLWRRHIPWARVAAVIALEGTVYGLMLGPLAAVLASSSHRLLGPDPAGDGPVGGEPAGAEPAGDLAADLVASLGAGIFEELVFRLALVSVLCLLLARACDALRVSRLPALIVGVAVSAVVFSAFHHLGPGAPPFERGVFLFRAAAGLLLGLLFVVRGFGVVVYTHAVYDIHYYLTHP